MIDWMPFTNRIWPPVTEETWGEAGWRRPGRQPGLTRPLVVIFDRNTEWNRINDIPMWLYSHGTFRKTPLGFLTTRLKPLQNYNVKTLWYVKSRPPLWLLFALEVCMKVAEPFWIVFCRAVRARKAEEYMVDQAQVEAMSLNPLSPCRARIHLEPSFEDGGFLQGQWESSVLLRRCWKNRYSVTFDTDNKIGISTLFQMC